MFTVVNCEQGSPEWFQARLGKITASVISSIVTSTGKISSSSDEVVNRAVAELIMGTGDDFFVSDAMLRGQNLEDEAIGFFNFTYDYQFEKCGFLDSGKGYGCSPDGIDFKNKKGLELKVPLAHTHLAYLADGGCPRIYKPQVQCSMLVSGFDSWVFGSYHPQLPCLRVEVERDEKIIDPMRDHLEKCCKLIQEKYLKIKSLVEAA